MKWTNFALVAIAALARLSAAAEESSSLSFDPATTLVPGCRRCEIRYGNCARWCPPGMVACLKECKKDVCLNGPEECRKGTECGKFYCREVLKRDETPEQSSSVEPATTLVPGCRRCEIRYGNCARWCPPGMVACLKECKKDVCLNGPEECRKGTECGKFYCREVLARHDTLDQPDTTTNTKAEATELLKRDGSKANDGDSCPDCLPPPTRPKSCDDCNRYFNNCARWCPPGMLECIKQCKIDTCLHGPQQCHKGFNCGDNWCKELGKREEPKPNDVDPSPDGLPPAPPNRPMSCDDCHDHFGKCAEPCEPGHEDCLKICRKNTCHSGPAHCREKKACGKFYCHDLGKQAVEKREPQLPDQPLPIAAVTCKACDKWYEGCHKWCPKDIMAPCIRECKNYTCVTGPPECRQGQPCGKNYCNEQLAERDTQSPAKSMEKREPQLPGQPMPIAAVPCDACDRHYGDCVRWCPPGMLPCIKECKKNTCLNGPPECHQGKPCGKNYCNELLAERQLPGQPMPIAAIPCDRCDRHYGDCVRWCPPDMLPCIKECKKNTCLNGPPECHQGQPCGKNYCNELIKRDPQPPEPVPPCDPCSKHYGECAKWCPPGMLNCLKECKRNTCNNGPPQCHKGARCDKNYCYE